MATYECNKCRISVKATCEKCDVTLVNGKLELNNGSNVQILKFTNGYGKIKSS